VTTKMYNESEVQISHLQSSAYGTSHNDIMQGQYFMGLTSPGNMKFRDISLSLPGTTTKLQLHVILNSIINQYPWNL